MTIAMLETEYYLEAEVLSVCLFFPLRHFQSKPAGSWAGEVLRTGANKSHFLVGEGEEHGSPKAEGTQGG